MGNTESRTARQAGPLCRAPPDVFAVLYSFLQAHRTRALDLFRVSEATGATCCGVAVNAGVGSACWRGTGQLRNIDSRHRRRILSCAQEFEQGKRYLSREDLALLVKKIVPGANPQEMLYFRVMARPSASCIV